MITHAFALALFMSPAGDNDFPPPKEHWAEVSKVLRETAIGMELLDLSESKYILYDIRDYKTDLNIIRDRYKECKNYPMSGEINGFPNRYTLEALMNFNIGYRTYLNRLIELGYDIDRELIKDLEYHYSMIDCLRDATLSYYNVVNKRKSLQLYKEYVGDEIFYKKGVVVIPSHLFVEK